jgi:hypothetical protein
LRLQEGTITLELVGHSDVQAFSTSMTDHDIASGFAFPLQIWLVHPNIPSPAALAAAVTGSGPAPTPNPPRVEYRATLKRHSGVVNCVRFCPKGELLATTGDGE